MIQFFEGELAPAEHLFVAFTGVLHALGGVPFEFHKTLRDASALFVSDKGQNWYQFETDKVIDRISRAMIETGATRLTCLGNSMGGFGALLFGSLCDADRVLAFAPQTVIHPEKTKAMGDGRWRRFQDKIGAFPYGDLLDLPPARGAILVYGDEPLDVAHAERLTWPCKRVYVAGSGHDAAAALKARGELMPLISSGII